MSSAATSVAGVVPAAGAVVAVVAVGSVDVPAVEDVAVPGEAVPGDALFVGSLPHALASATRPTSTGDSTQRTVGHVRDEASSAIAST
jgi:hypothetical protein